MDISQANPVESQLVFYNQDRMIELAKAAERAVERMKVSGLNSARVQSVVTLAKKKRNFLGLPYTKVHTMDYVTWQVNGAGIVLLLGSDGNLYALEQCRNFWGYPVERLMPFVEATRGDVQHYVDCLDRLGVAGSITGFF